MEIRDILAQLKEPFAPGDHVERDLKGGGKWFFVPWQRIRDRLDAVCPDWQVEYGEPNYLDKFCVISCTLTIAGVSRKAWGNAEIELLSSTGKDMSRGTPIERAIADAFKNAAEAFGVAAYLDDQSKDKREFTLTYLQRKGDGRGVKYATENQWIPSNLPARAENREEQARKEVEAIRAKNRPKTAAKPAAVQSQSDNGARFTTIKNWTGFKFEDIRRFSRSLNLPDQSGDLSEAQCLQLRDEIFVQWGFYQGKFKALNHARNSYSNLLASFDFPDPEDGAVWLAWQTKVNEKPSIEQVEAS